MIRRSRLLLYILLISVTVLFFLIKAKNKYLPKQNIRVSFSQQEDQRQDAKPDTKISTFLSAKKDVLEEETDIQKKVNILVKQLDSSDSEVASKAIEELVSKGNRVVRYLSLAYSDSSLAQKGQILFILGKIKAEEAASLIITAMKDNNSYLRRNAIEAAGRIKSNVFLSAISESLTDEKESVRRAAAWALGELADPVVVPDLTSQLKKESSELVRLAIVEALGKIKDKRATSFLLQELEKKANTYYLNKLVFSLGEIGDSQAVIPLREYRERLLKNKPKEKILLLEWEDSINTVEEALRKLQN